MKKPKYQAVNTQQANTFFFSILPFLHHSYIFRPSSFVPRPFSSPTFSLIAFSAASYCLQLEEVHSVTDEFFDLPNTIKSRYPYGDENHGWTAVEQER